MELQVKKLRGDAILPTKAHKSDAGWDLYVVSDEDFVHTENGFDTFVLKPGHSHIFHTGISCSFPPGYVALLWDRSGIGAKRKIHRLAGVIDCSYRGEWLVCLVNLSDQPHRFVNGDKIVQVLFHEVPDVTLREVTELDETLRGEKGFGSSG